MLIKLFFLLAINSLYQSGELVNIEILDQSAQDYSDTYYRGKYLDDIAKYRFFSIEQSNYDVVMYGNSRVNQFRSWMFEPYEFYNYCNQGTSPIAIYKFLNELFKTQNPKIILVQIEPQNLKKDFSGTDLLKFLDQDFVDSKITEGRFSSTLEFLGNPSNLNHFLNDEFLGIKANVDKSGIRMSDGSVSLMEKTYATSVSRQKKYISIIHSTAFSKLKLKRMLNLVQTEIQISNLNLYQKIDSLCTSNNSKVIFFTPPYSRLVYSYFETHKEKYPLWHLFKNDFTSLMNERELDYYNFRNLTAENDYEIFMRDLLHPSERLSAKILVELMDKSSRFSETLPSLKQSYLQEIIKSKSKYPLAKLD